MLNLVVGESRISESTKNCLLGHLRIVGISFTGLEELSHSVSDDEDTVSHGFSEIRRA